MKKYILGTLLCAACFNINTFASEISVTDVNAVLYTTAEAELLADTDISAVVLNKEAMPDNAPIQVTGITSNGYFRVELDGTYYIAGNGLVEASSGSATVAESTPVQQSKSKYVCVIEEGDKKLYEQHTYGRWPEWQTTCPRTDMTSHPNYIAMRDEIEAAIARGETVFETNKYESHNTYDASVSKNLVVDLIKAHPGYKFMAYSDCPTASMYAPYTGEQFAYIYAIFSKIS